MISNLTRIAAENGQGYAIRKRDALHVGEPFNGTLSVRFHNVTAVAYKFFFLICRRTTRVMKPQLRKLKQETLAEYRSIVRAMNESLGLSLRC